MSNLDELRLQVDELKQRLGASDAQQQTEAGELKTWLASIKASVQGKQDEIDRLTAENEQLRRMLAEAVSAINEHHAQAPGNVLRDIHAEMAALIEPGEAANAEDGEAPSATARQDEALAAAQDSPALRRIMQRGQRGK